jgi:hypothetical protein
VRWRRRAFAGRCYRQRLIDKWTGQLASLAMWASRA